MTRIKLILTACLSLLLLSFSPQKPEPVTAETALQSYLQNGDRSFAWEVKDSFRLDQVMAYDLLLTSQQWREHTWTHQLTVLVPAENKHDGTLLFITGGSVANGQPKWKGQDDERLQSFAQVAAKNQAITALIRQVPNQPLYDDMTEDELISFTLDNFKKDHDYTWPLLFPMTKSAIRAMDAIQEFSASALDHDVARFVVSGASKRGWTTWLTGASDKRVVAIAPMVIDMLNMPVNLDYQVQVWGDYSVQIQDYVKLGIPQAVHTEEGDEITTMIDPYAYREKLTMSKMLFMGTNDEYWPIDAVKNYLDDIPGQNFIHYVPNAGHDLGGGQQAVEALSAFFGNTLQGNAYPVCQWDITEKEDEIALNVTATPDQLVDAVLWSADSEDRDFRDEEWVSQPLGAKNQQQVQARIDYPASGYKAFYLDLQYADPNGGVYSESTQAYVADDDEVFVTQDREQAGETTQTWAEKLGYPSGKRVVILHADDIGMSQEANVSAKRYLKDDHIQSAAAMPPCPNFEEFIKWAKEPPQEDVGLHLTLTSEWKTYRWGPVADPADVPGLIDSEGKLWHTVQQVVEHATPEEVEKEIRAQVEKSLALGYRPDHIDTHMGTLYGTPEFTAAYTKVAEEYGIPAMVIEVSNPAVVQTLREQGYPVGDDMLQVINSYQLPKLDYFYSMEHGQTYEEKREKFFALVRFWNPGLIEIIFHPAEDTQQLKTITNSWQQRVWEAQLFSDPDVIQFLKDENIIFTNWKEIMKRFEEGVARQE